MIIKTKIYFRFMIFIAVTLITALCFSSCGIKKKVSVENIKVGDTVSFGDYEQNNIKSDGAEKIEWLVLAKENDKVLLISKYALDCKIFCDEDTDISWEDSYLRSWLNTTFFQNAFNDIEKNNIALTEIKSDKNIEETIKDKIFVLDNDEAEMYFKSDISRRCSPTAYAKQCGAKSPSDLQDVEFDEELKNNCCYWLRSPGFHNDKVSIIDYEGTIYNRGEFADEEISVRPVLWVKNLQSSD